MPQFTASDGVRIVYYVDDATPPWLEPDTIVLMHPAMGSARRYFAWIPRLCGHYRVLRMDMRGHGASEVPGPDKPLDMQRLMNDTLELLDHAGVPSAHFVGNSAGGYISQHLAMNNPERVKSLMLFSSTPGLRQSNWPEWMKKVKAVGLRQFLAENIDIRLPVDRMDPAHVEWFLDEAGRLDPEFGARFVMYMSSQDWTDQLPRIRQPTLIARPGLGTPGIGSADIFEKMHALIPNSQLVTYEDLPVHLTDAVPERCVDDVLAFLRWHFGAPNPRGKRQAA